MSADYFATILLTPATLSLQSFWSTLFTLLLPIWPSRTLLPSHPIYPLGDVWPCPSLSKSLDQAGKVREEGDDFVPFHKLTQWLCYSLIEAIESEAGWNVDRGRGQTGLPEVSPNHPPLKDRVTVNNVKMTTDWIVPQWRSSRRSWTSHHSSRHSRSRRLSQWTNPSTTPLARASGNHRMASYHRHHLVSQTILFSPFVGEGAYEAKQS